MKKTSTVNEIAQYLNVSTDSIYTMVREHQIPHVRIRRRIIFLDEVVEQWLKEQSSIR